MKKQITYKADVEFYDFVNDPARRALMLEKVEKNLTRAGDLHAFRAWLVRDMDNAKAKLDMALTKYINIKDQILFVDKLIAGEIKNKLRFGLMDKLTAKIRSYYAGKQ